MAGDDLLAALLAGQYKPAETSYGIAAGGVGSAIPNLVDPYASPTSNIAYAGGATILAALLGSMAKDSAQEENAIIRPLQTKFLDTSTTDEERQAMLNGEYGSRLSPLYGVLAKNQMDLAEAKAKKEQELKLTEPYDIAKENRQQTIAQRAALASAANQALGNRGDVLDPATGSIVHLEGTSPADVAAAKILAESKVNQQLTGSRGGLSPKDIANLETEYTKTLTNGPVAQNIIEVQSRGQQVLDAIKKQSPLNAATAIYGMAKVLDPAGVVRKEDGTIVADPGGPAGQLASLGNQIMQKGQLTDDTIKAMRELVPQIVGAQYRAYGTQRDAMISAAEKQGAIRGNIGFIPEPKFESSLSSGSLRASDLISQGYQLTDKGWVRK